LRQLIVNADDLGADVARNDGIFEAVKAGTVTSVSILVNAPAFDDALARILSSPLQISIGVHLNISEGVPLSSELKWLTNSGGSFYGKAETHRRLLDNGNDLLRTEIRREFTAQIRTLAERGIKIDHLDGHQHVHVFPAAIEVTACAAEEFGIPWIRIPEEPTPNEPLAKAGSSYALEAATFSRLAASARAQMSKSSLKMTEHFRGLYLKGLLSLEFLEQVFQSLPPGLTELMVHPGKAPGESASGSFSAFSNAEREKELAVLKSSGFQLLLKKHSVQLTSFPEGQS
jgi:chitin disaccharide deacetylase